MEELHIKKEYAQCYEVKDLEKDNDNCLRIYCCQYPDTFTFQIRTYKPITQWHSKRSKSRNMIAHVNLNIEDMEYILAYMKSRKDKD